MAHHLDPIYQAIDDVIAKDHQRELDAFTQCHETEAFKWAGEVDLLRQVKVILERGSLDAWTTQRH